ncbi:MAG: KaiC domain-containing protein [Candidatus Syntrophoarchaeum sp.]|nr:KaiC domain-containing protein [Candidatus Syntrophoarchaeum sp.]
MERLSVGIEGIDEMLGGGFPRGHTVLLVGGYGTGKTTFSLQYTYHGLLQGDSAIYITLDQSEKEIVDTAADYGWDLERYIREGKLLVVRFNPADIKVSIERIASELPGIIKNFGTKRLVFDSITLLEILFASEAERREHVFFLANLFKQSGITTILTSESATDDSLHSKYGFIEYVSDGVISLRYIRQCELREVSLALEIVKMRRSAHSRKIRPYSITNEGIVVHSSAELF